MNEISRKIKSQKIKVKRALRAAEQRSNTTPATLNCCCSLNCVLLCLAVILSFISTSWKSFERQRPNSHMDDITGERGNACLSTLRIDSYASKAIDRLPWSLHIPSKPKSLGCLPTQADWSLQRNAPSSGQRGERQSGLSLRQRQPIPAPRATCTISDMPAAFPGLPVL